MRDRARRRWTMVAAALAAAACGPVPGPGPGPLPAAPEEGESLAPAGPLAPVRGNGAEVVLAAGIYEGDLLIEGNGNEVHGAGPARTVVRGGLTVRGDGNIVHSLRVQGPSTVAGENNVVTNVVFDSGVDDSGNVVDGSAEEGR